MELALVGRGNGKSNVSIIGEAVRKKNKNKKNRASEGCIEPVFKWVSTASTWMVRKTSPVWEHLSKRPE